MINLLLTVNSPGVYYAYLHSDNVGRAIVLLLIAFSIVTWSVMVDKWLSLSKDSKLSKKLFYIIIENDNRSLTSKAFNDSAQALPSSVSNVYFAGVDKLLELYEKDYLRNNPDVGGNAQIHPTLLCEAEFEAVEVALETQVSEEIKKLESKIGLLATFVSLSPFLGLFGTVWGVMMAFCGVAIAGKSDFTALAPGVAGALLTTVAGLVVAVPSLVGYNFINGKIKEVTVTMDNFVGEFMARLRLEQVELSRRVKERQ